MTENRCVRIEQSEFEEAIREEMDNLKDGKTMPPGSFRTNIAERASLRILSKEKVKDYFREKENIKLKRLFRNEDERKKATTEFLKEKILEIDKIYSNCFELIPYVLKEFEF